MAVADGVGVADADASVEVDSTVVLVSEEVEDLVETAVVVPVELTGVETTGLATEEMLAEAGTTGNGVVPEAGTPGTGVAALDSAVSGTGTLVVTLGATPGVMVAEKICKYLVPIGIDPKCSPPPAGTTKVPVSD